MVIKRKILLGKNSYQIFFNVSYKKSIINKPKLVLTKYNNDYWDSGVISKLIEKIEKNYNLENIKKYDEDISYMADILYIYEHIPFFEGINDCSSEEECYISKEEIKKYIRIFNKKIITKKIKLNDESTWNI